MKDETLLTDEVIESLEMLTSRNYFREWIKNPTGYVAGSIAVRDLVNAVLFADACRAAIQSGNSGQVPDEKLPLNYLQGQKDGLEWAAQMAEASHPQTGDWLYDDPIELAKSIRKGPDMPNHDNTLVIPDGLIAAINRLLDSDGSRGCFSAIECYGAHEEIERLLAAAPKGV